MSYEDFAEEEDFSLNSQKEGILISKDSEGQHSRQKETENTECKQISFIYGR